MDSLSTAGRLRAAEIAEGVIADSEGSGGPKELQSLRAVLRIAFEVEAFLASRTNGQESSQWMQDTLFSGLESIDNLRPLWQMISFMQDDELKESLPSDPIVLREDLAKAWRAVQEHASSVPIPLYLRDKGPGPETFPTDLDDVHRRLGEALRSVEDRALPIVIRIRAVHVIARLQILLLGATLW